MNTKFVPLVSTIVICLTEWSEAITVIGGRSLLQASAGSCDSGFQPSCHISLLESCSTAGLGCSANGNVLLGKQCCCCPAGVQRVQPVGRPPATQEKVIDFLLPSKVSDIDYIDPKRVPEVPEFTLGDVGTAQFAQLSSNGAAYVALGDSYSAGNGAAALIGDLCRQAPGAAWPQLVANALSADGKLPGPYTPAACSGYTITKVYSLLDKLSADTKLVTITVGGNDIGFADTIKICVLVGGCFRAVQNAEDKIASLQVPLAQLYYNIAVRAPNATVYVAGYPDIVPSAAITACIEQGLLSAAEQQWLRSLVVPLNMQVTAAVNLVNNWVGPRFVFVDVQERFRGHQPCTEVEYVNPIVGESIVDIDREASYHPNARGQEAYACQVISAMNLELPSYCGQHFPSLVAQ